MKHTKDEIITEAKKWKYENEFMDKIRHLYKDKILLDVGMGAGPYSVLYIEKGCKEYTGIVIAINDYLVRYSRAKAGE